MPLDDVLAVTMAGILLGLLIAGVEVILYRQVIELTWEMGYMAAALGTVVVGGISGWISPPLGGDPYDPPEE